MTVIFNRTFRYSDGVTYTGGTSSAALASPLSPAVEADMIAHGFATSTTVATPAVQVMSQYNPVTGGVRFSFGGALERAIYNLKPSNSQKFRVKLKSFASSGVPAIFARVGDSTTLGAGAGTNTGGSSTGCAGAWQNAPMQQLAASLNAAGLGASNNFWAGDGFSDTTSYSTYDSRFTLGSGWGFSGSVPSMGGFAAKYTVGTVGNLALQMQGVVSKINVYYMTVPALGDFDVLVNGVVVASASCNAALGFKVVSATISATASPVVSIRPANNASVYIAAIEGYSTEPLLLRQFANFGRLVGDLVAGTDPWSPMQSLDLYKNDVTLINITINDANAPTSKTAYRAALELLVQRALKTGDVWLELGAISNTAQTTNGALYDIQDAVMAVAATYDLPVLSFPAVMQSFAAANSAGWMFDTKHPTTLGYAQENAVVSSAVIAVSA